MPAVVDIEKCDGCKTCVDSCPNQSIACEEPQNKAVVKTDDCIDCGACVDACPSHAIEMKD
jgi:NAD-dependent dihydropyrimidine dehydrogenase PreA subunit